MDGRILVPFGVESSLSGVGRTVGPDNRLWYRRAFRLPSAWAGQRIWLRFDAVDWDTTVWVNGHEMGRHSGGYDPFAFDITAALVPGADQQVTVSVWDPSDAGPQPRGKQVQRPRSIWYTPTTGIWQTVWLEPLPEVAIDRLTIVPDVDAGTVTLTASVTGAAGGSIRLRIPAPRLWSPGHPFLYDLTIALDKGATRVDEVGSCVGLRKIAIGRSADGVMRLLLNNEPLFQYGFLDQGFWPDGLHTAPTDEARRFDIAWTREIGMNLARKHIKVEPDRWY